jgi:hypothetical protein
VVVTTEKFIELALLEARSLGVPDLRFELIPHPLGGIPAELAVARGRMLAETIAGYLIRPPDDRQ